MTNLSITLPDNIAEASNQAAKSLGISRTEFIRQAVIHELNQVQVQIEQNEIVKSFIAMKKSKKYLLEANEIMENLNSDLSEEEDLWRNSERS